MICEFDEKLDRYLDSELSAAELTDMQKHLRTCPACAAEALGRLQLKQMNRAAAQRYSVAPGFRLKTKRIVAPPRRPWLPLVAALAALALILISANAWLQHARAEQEQGELADLHVSTLASANPVDILSTDRHTVKPWFQGKLPFTFNLPELSNSPFHLIGGRLTYLQQSPSAQLLFESGKHKTSVFIFQNRPGASPLDGPSLRNNLNFNSETWSAGGLRYFLITDSSSSDLHALSDLLKSAAH